MEDLRRINGPGCIALNQARALLSRCVGRNCTRTTVTRNLFEKIEMRFSNGRWIHEGGPCTLTRSAVVGLINLRSALFGWLRRQLQPLLKLLKQRFSSSLPGHSTSE